MISLARTIAAAAVLTACAGAAFADTVTVKIDGIRPTGGQIVASLSTETQFMKGAGTYNLLVEAPAAGGSATLVFKDVKPGRYALNVMHDQDRNMQMKQGANGMPQEGFAMKNGEFLMGPPNWAEQSFDVGAAPLSMTERMIYFPGS